MTTVLDNSKCSKCNICIEICPRHLIVADKATGFPILVPEHSANCTVCGHCEAVCPQSAVTVSSLQLEAAMFSGKEPAISAKQMGSYIESRRSIRVYEDKPVPKKTFEELLDIARYSPSGLNGQPVRWIVVQDPAKAKEYSRMTIEWMRSMLEKKAPLAAAMNFGGLVGAWDKGINLICRNAPHLVVIYAHKDNLMAVGDSAIALTVFELAAPAFGLGACWAGYFRMAASGSPELKKELGIPEDHTCTGAMMVGFPKHKYRGIPKRNKESIIWK